MHRVTTHRDHCGVQPLAQVRQHLKARLAVVLARVFLGDGGVSQSSSATRSNDRPRSAMFLAFFAGSNVSRILVNATAKTNWRQGNPL